MSGRLSFRVEQLGSHWKNVHETWGLNTFRNSVQKFQVRLKFYKNNGYFTWRQIYVYDPISLSSP
jgi:hypothetical protein